MKMQIARIISLSAVIVVSGCCSSSHYPKHVEQVAPPAEALAWFQVPKDDRVFKNQIGDYDTLIYKDTITYGRFDEEQELYYGDCKTYYSHGSLFGYFLRKHGGEFIYVARISSQSAAPTIDFRLDSGAYNYTDDILLPTNDTTITVNGVFYSDVSVIDNIGKNNLQGLLFRKVYYSKSKGFVKYISPDLDVWELTN